MLIARHGGSSHYVRPDRVIRTGVIESIVGYSPQQDVMNVAQEFTQGPYLFQQGSANVTTAGMSGPRAQLFGARQPGGVRFLGPGTIENLGLIQKLVLKFRVWRATKKAMAFQAAGMSGLGGFTPYGPQAWAGGRVVPEAAARVGMLIAMQQKDQPQEIAMNNSEAILARWNFMRGPTR